MRVAIVAFAAGASACLWQFQASAQTVQLPTFTFATVGTTVSVPDRGAAFLGGIGRLSEGHNEFGVPGLAVPGLQSRSYGRETSASNMWATVTIHDFDAMDQAILSGSSNDTASAAPPSLRSISGLPAIPPLASTTRLEAVNLAGNWRGQPVASAPASTAVAKVAVEEADREARRTTRATEADDYFARGQKAEAEGKPSVAKIYYQMAARRASGELKQQALARLDVLSGRAAAVAKSAP